MKYYSTLRSKRILTFTTTWMNLEDTMLNEVKQAHKGKYCVIPLK